MNKTILLFCLLTMLNCVLGSAAAEDAIYTCDQNIEDFWNRDYDNLTIDLNETCTRRVPYYTEYEFKNITAKNVDCIDKQNAAKFGAFIKLTDSYVDYMRYENVFQSGGISLRGSSGIGTLELFSREKEIFLSGSGDDYENKITPAVPENHSVGRIIFHTDKNNLRVISITADELTVIRTGSNLETIRITIRNNSYIGRLFASGPVELQRTLVAGIPNTDRFDTTIGTLIYESQGFTSISLDGMIIDNSIILGTNSNTDAAITLYSNNYGRSENVIVLGNNFTVTNYMKYGGKPTIGTLYFDNCGINKDDVASVINNTNDAVAKVLSLNMQKAPIDIKINYYITLNYADIDNIRYSPNIPEPNISKNNNSFLLGSAEPF